MLLVIKIYKEVVNDAHATAVGAAVAAVAQAAEGDMASIPMAHRNMVECRLKQQMSAEYLKILILILRYNILDLPHLFRHRLRREYRRRKEAERVALFAVHVGDRLTMDIQQLVRKLSKISVDHIPL